MQGRLEIAETEESTLRQDLECERRRTEGLRRELEAERSKGFWLRMFGG